MEREDFARVSVAIDLSRAQINPVVEFQLQRTIMIGREVDLLEVIRRTERHEEVSMELVRVHALSLKIDPNLLEEVTLKQFADHGIVEFLDGRVIPKYSETSKAYEYGAERLKHALKEGEERLLSVLVQTLHKPVSTATLDAAIEALSSRFAKTIKEFLLSNKIVVDFAQKREHYVVSPRIYKDEKKFQEALEILEDHKLNSVTEFLQNNPGNPAPVVEQHLNVQPGIILYLSDTGLIDPLRLNVRGDTKDYLFSADLASSRPDSDHTDLVKKTLANFRFGEYYSDTSRLRSLDEFLSSMLDRGFAGYASAIGTDYRELEGSVFRVTKVSGNKFRFWMLKRDVIEDSLSILRGIIPIHSDKRALNLTNIDNVVQTRLQIDPKEVALTKRQIQDAVRDIQDGMGS